MNKTEITEVPVMPPPNDSTRMYGTAATIIVFVFVLGILYSGQFLFVPLCFSIIFSVLLLPICKRLEVWRFNRVWSTTVTMLLITISLIGVIVFFGSQISTLFFELTDFKINLERLFYKLIEYVAGLFNISNSQIMSTITDNKSKLIQGGANFLQNTVSTGGDFLTFSSLSLVFTFLILLYRSGFRHYILIYFKDESRESVNNVIDEIQAVILNYFQGVLVVMLIIGTLNTIGLTILGVEYAPLFGFLASFLTIIPYVGTTFGAALPFVFALVNYKEPWHALGIIPMNIIIQQLEANFITPKIVGGKVSVNALFAFISLIVAGVFWGLAGMVLAIPLTAIAKTVMFYIPQTQKLSYLLSNDFPDKTFEAYLQPIKPSQSAKGSRAGKSKS